MVCMYVLCTYTGIFPQKAVTTMTTRRRGRGRDGRNTTWDDMISAHVSASFGYIYFQYPSKYKSLYNIQPISNKSDERPLPILLIYLHLKKKKMMF